MGNKVLESIYEKKMEDEASIFACLLLMPKKFIHEDLKKGLDLGDDEAFKKLCKKYEVSAAQLAFRLHLMWKHGV